MDRDTFLSLESGVKRKFAARAKEFGAEVRLYILDPDEYADGSIAVALKRGDEKMPMWMGTGTTLDPIVSSLRDYCEN